MKKKIALFVCLVLIPTLAISCGPKIAVEDQVQTDIAETAIVRSAEQTAIAAGIAATLTAYPTNTATNTDIPTLTWTPTISPTWTITPTLTRTAVPLPPFYLSFHSVIPCGGGYILVLSISNNTTERLYAWRSTVKYNDQSIYTEKEDGFYNIAFCAPGQDSFVINPGASGFVYTRFSNFNPTGIPLQASVTVYTRYRFQGDSYSSSLYFTP